MNLDDMIISDPWYHFISFNTFSQENVDDSYLSVIKI